MEDRLESLWPQMSLDLVCLNSPSHRPTSNWKGRLPGRPPIHWLASSRLPYERKAEEEDEEVESTWNPAKLLRHCNGIDLKGRLTGNFRGARNSSSSLFVSFLGFDFGFGRFLLRGR